MATIELPIKNFEAQQTIFDCQVPHVVVPKGRRFGLTRGASNDYIKKALKKEFKRGLWVDTVNANIERYVERYFLPALNRLPEGSFNWRKQQKILEIMDSYIDFRSADNPENIEGFDYDKYFLNEAGIILKNEYLYHNAIKPMLWTKGVRGVIGGTPKGRGLFEQLYQRGLDPNQPNYKSFKFSSFDNPYVPHDLLMADMKDMPERVVKQEIYAEFLDDTGVVFRGVRDIAILQPEEQKMDHLYVIGADLAKVQDYTVLTVYDRKNNNQVYQMRFNQLEWPFQKQKIRDLSLKFNRAVVYIDSTGLGEPIYEDLVRSGVPCEPIHFTNEMKKQLIEKLSSWIELKNIHMLDLEETVQEFNSFTYDYSEKTGRVIYGAPPGFHDDICFVKDTQILTDKGNIPIQDIHVGSMVLTRKGYKRVKKVFSRNAYVCSNIGLRGTPTHPIFTTKGLVRLANVCDSDIIYTWNQRKSSIEEKLIIAIQNQNGDTCGYTFGTTGIIKSHLYRFIDKCGLIKMRKYLKDLLFTIKTAILLTINFLIYFYLKTERMFITTWFHQNNVKDQGKMESNKYLDLYGNYRNGEKKIPVRFIKWLQKTENEIYQDLSQEINDGEKQKKGRSFLGKMLTKVFMENHEKLFVSNVKNLLRQRLNKKLSTVVNTVDMPIERVYNFHVEDEHEYFANNILVHNCFSHALAIWGLTPIIQTVREPKKTLIQRDYEEKIKIAQSEQRGELDFTEFEEV